MSNGQTLNPMELSDVLEKAVETGQICVMSHLTNGKWHRVEVKICSESRKAIMLELLDNPVANVDTQIDQPIGVAFEIDFTKYLFESTVIGLESAVKLKHNSRIMIRKPNSIEKMMRRSYKRVPVPNKLIVNTLFWHRGYTDNSTEVPIESYWQGRMLDLSAGGAQITVTKDHFQNFKLDQYIGMQFTPLPFEKPIIVEGQLKHIAVSEDGETISLGIEFLGLEASRDGRVKLDKIVETLEVYQKGQVSTDNPETSEEIAQIS